MIHTNVWYNGYMSDLVPSVNHAKPQRKISRKIIHVDMDCFYAAVEVKHHPELRGKALGIGGPPSSRSVLCTASYEARKFGVRSAMASSLAVKICPELILRPPNFDLYKKESQSVRRIFERFTDKIEPLSLDEAYLDVTDSKDFKGSATLIAQEIRAQIQKELNLTASAGAAPNKFLAKVASDWRKPDGIFVVRPDQVASFVKTLPVERIFGVGKVTAKRMHELGLRNCGDLQKHTVEQLTDWFGSRGESLAELARGEDDRDLETHWERKSLTVEETFDRDILSLDSCLRVIPNLYADWMARMKKANCFDRVRGFVVKIKFFDFQSTTHETSLIKSATEKDFADLFQKAWARRSAPVRLIGLGARLGTTEPEEKSGPIQLRFAF